MQKITAQYGQLILTTYILFNRVLLDKHVDGVKCWGIEWATNSKYYCLDIANRKLLTFPSTLGGELRLRFGKFFITFHGKRRHDRWMEYTQRHVI